MPEYVTNTVVEGHNTWTLIKHAAGSINKAAAKTDAVVYGTQVKVEVKPKPFEDSHPILAVMSMVLMGVLLLAVFIGFLTGNIRGRDMIGF